ncbi:MAG: hypothetical protein M3Q30_01320 [Actinomycetota bacterium]|nr:hypothetical protein [Actinomycetota bacterium]
MARVALAAFADNPKGAVAAFESESFDVGAGCFGDPQSIEGKERDEGMVAGVAESGGDEHGADLVAVEAGRVRFVIETRSSDVHRGRYRDESFLFGVAVEAGDRAQPSRDRGPGTTHSLELAGEGLNVRTFHIEQGEAMVGAVGDVLAQIERVCLMGEAGVTGQESGEREPFRLGERFVFNDRGREKGTGNRHDILQSK